MISPSGLTPAQRPNAVSGGSAADHLRQPGPNGRVSLLLAGRRVAYSDRRARQPGIAENEAKSVTAGACHAPAELYELV